MSKNPKENIELNNSDKKRSNKPVLVKDLDIKIMSYVMVVIVMIAVIAATVAWFRYYKTASVTRMSMMTADCSSLKVEVKVSETGAESDFVEVKEGDEDNVVADLFMPVFDNVETYEITVGTSSESGDSAGDTSSESGDSTGSTDSTTTATGDSAGTTDGEDSDGSDNSAGGKDEDNANTGNGTNTGESTVSGTTTKTVNKMAPGVYGSLTIRLTPLNSQIDHYRIATTALYSYIDSLKVDYDADGTLSATQTDSNVKILQELAKGHILFFAGRAERTQSDSTGASENGGTSESTDLSGNGGASASAGTSGDTSESTDTSGNGRTSESVGASEAGDTSERDDTSANDSTSQGTGTSESSSLSEQISIDGKTYEVGASNSKYIFYDQIEDDGFLEGELKWNTDSNEGETTEVTIYWYWPYEYANLGSRIQNKIKLPENLSELSDTDGNKERLMYFDKEKLAEIADGTGSWTETQLYDYADTRIGTYVKSIKIRLEVDGYHGTNAEEEKTE